jgi:TRAP-type C4-dicarboxylate transport system permease small subunit
VYLLITGARFLALKQEHQLEDIDMDYFINLIRRTTGWGMACGATFLTGMMVLIVANIITRLFGHVIQGSYEISTLMIVVSVAFALGYAGVQKSHVVVKIVIDRFSPRWQAVIAIITSLISMATWAVIGWASYTVLAKRLLTEVTDLLDVPYLPFRIIFVAGVAILCLVYLTDLIKAFKEAVIR